jgi:hypothetical protein
VGAALTLAFGLVGEHPGLAVLAQAEYVAALAKRLSRQIKQCIHLVSSRRDLLKPKLLKACDQALDIRYAEFNFDFMRGRHQRQYSGRQTPLVLHTAEGTELW